jgi:hypothetical protein
VGRFGSGLYHGCLNAPKKKVRPSTLGFKVYIHRGILCNKTPEVNPSWVQTRTCKASLHSACRSGFTTGTPDKPEFFAKQKMRPNEVLKKPSPSVDFL